jgi:predicted alpha/beta-fold hydrolase
MDQFRAAKGLKNRHLQTIYSSLFRHCPVQTFDTEEFTLADGDFVDCYWYQQPAVCTLKPIVTLFHGLAGSYQSPYIQGIMLYLHQAGYSVVLMHFRGCSGRQNKTPRAYHSGDTADAKAWLNHLRNKFPNSLLFAVGYSLGGNMLLKLLGEEGSKSPLTAAVAVSAPMQLAICSKTIQQGFAKIYQQHLLRPLKAALIEKYKLFDFQKLIKLSEKRALSIATLEEFDDFYTSKIHGFYDADDYYEQASCAQYLTSIDINTLIIHAIDDPFMTSKVLPESKNLPANVVLEVSAHGGHLGFISGSILKPEYWLEKRILRYFSAQQAILPNR